MRCFVGLGGFEGSGGVQASSSSVAAYPPTPLQRKFSPDYYVLHGPHWAAQGVRTPGPPPASYAAGRVGPLNTPLVWCTCQLVTSDWIDHLEKQN